MALWIVIAIAITITMNAFIATIIIANIITAIAIIFCTQKQHGT